MNKGTLIQFLKGNTTHRFPKLVTLAVASSVLVTMVTIDASASTRTYVGTTAVASSFSTSVAAQTNAALTPFRYRRNAPNTTTTNPSSRSTSLSSTTEPSSTTSGPTPTTTTTVASTTTNGRTPTTTTTVASTTTNGRTPTTTTTVPVVTTTTPAPTTTTTAAPAPNLAYPTGTVNSSEPSGYAPPSASALAGYSQTYVTDFTGSSLPSGWGSYSGTPGGDPGGQFGSAHVIVGDGLLSLNTYQDPSYNNEWVTGGLCQCGFTQTYGAYFVRSRVTGTGPTGVELLWPTVGWPPEIDFNETGGGATSTTATNIWAATSNTKSQQQVNLNIDMTQWHTWGVIWTPTSITYTVDGKVWGTMKVPSEIPDQPMTLDLQQQTWCSSGWACPTTPQSMQVDWVAEYQAS